MGFQEGFLMSEQTTVQGTGKAARPPKACKVLADADRTFTCVPDTFLFILTQCHNMCGNGPFAIGKGTLTEKGVSSDVYVLLMHGLEVTLLGECNELIPVLAASLWDAKTRYSTVIKKALRGTVPEGSKLLVIGHSFGGMTAQQLAADPDVYEHYDILYTTAIASPLLKYGKGKGQKFNRLLDKGDVVPFLSYNTLLRPKQQLREVVKENSHTGVMSHVLSYQNKEVWGTYDAVGNKGGDSVIHLDEVRFFNAPRLPFQLGKRFYKARYDASQNNWVGWSILI